MNRKKFFLLIIMVYALGNAFQTMAMFSKPTFDEEDKEYTKIQMPKEKATELLLQQLLNPNPSPEYIETLIKQGADINAGSYLGARLLHAAAIRNNLPLAKLLIRYGATVDITENNGNTPLHLACEEGNMNAIKLLCENGANVNSKNHMGASPLHRACEFGHLDTIIFLVRNGARVNAGDNEFLTPLHTACGNGFFKIVDFLIKNKADIHAKNYKNSTPLHFACIPKNSGSIITLLIKKGADINAVTKSPAWTPLHLAAVNDNAQACALLLKAKANPFITTSDGLTALDIAYDLGHKNIITLLQSHNPQTTAQADANMQKFFAELNQEAVSKKKKMAKKRKKPQPQPTVEISPKAHTTNVPELSSDITEDELMINQPLEEQLIEKQRIEPTTPATEVVIETPSTTTPVVQPTASAPMQRPIKIIQQKSVHPDVAPAPGNNGYLILIGQNLKWPHLNKNQEQLIKNNLLSLKNWPTHNLDIKQLKGAVNMYRLRVGNYRILFSVDTARREIKVQKIGLRKEIYKQYKS